MAQSIYEVMDGRMLQVVNGTKTFEVDVPSWFPTSLDQAALDKLVKEFGADAILSKAASQIIIELRAAARAGQDSKDSDEVKAVEAYKVEAPRKPKTKMTKQEMALALFAEMTEDEIKAVLKAAKG